MAAIQIFQSPAARHRLAAAAQFVASFTPSTELLLVGASREAVDDFARELSSQQRATFGIHRFSLTELASRLAAMELARLGVAPARLGSGPKPSPHVGPLRRYRGDPCGASRLSSPAVDSPVR